MAGNAAVVTPENEIPKCTPGAFRTWLRENQKWALTTVLVVCCLGPTFISYKSYHFTWDDATYLEQSIRVSQIIWSGSTHGLRLAVVGSRPPAMTMLGLPWGPLTTWDAAGKCFITLAAMISLLAASCLYLLLRIGIRPAPLVVAAVCVGASLGPYPHDGWTHAAATGFLADTLLAWTTLLAMLLIPYEARTSCPLLKDAVLRGIIWGSILSFGIMTKLSFAYFVVFIVPLLFSLHFSHNGFRNGAGAVFGLIFSSIPAALYLLMWGQSAFQNAKASSFGTTADLYYVPLLEFFSHIFSDAPGLVVSLTVMTAATIFLLIKGRLMHSWPDFLTLSIMIGFTVIVLCSRNREIRFLFPAIVTLPFLIAILLSDKAVSASSVSAVLAPGFVFFVFLAAAVPMRYRTNSQDLDRSNAVLAQAERCGAKHITLATNTPTLNSELMSLAMALSKSRTLFQVSGLPRNNLAEVLPAEEGFGTVRASDQVIFQHSDATSHNFNWINLWRFNQRVPEYENYLRTLGYVPIDAHDDVRIYLIGCQLGPNPLR